MPLKDRVDIWVLRKLTLAAVFQGSCYLWLVQDDRLGCEKNMVEFIFVFILTIKISVLCFTMLILL